MEPDKSNECLLHGAGVSAQSMVGRRLAEVVGSWHMYGSAVPAGPKILRDCRLKGDGVHHAMLGIARMHNLALAG